LIFLMRGPPVRQVIAHILGDVLKVAIAAALVPWGWRALGMNK